MYYFLPLEVFYEALFPILEEFHDDASECQTQLIAHVMEVLNQNFDLPLHEDETLSYTEVIILTK